ncbi:IclR family transcriptional regulator domain-containing protein [Actinocrinis puniceicyclus]|uniref:IclR family transcriptional regulator domain-containing protein n=1 Tax=Actinocrinis puniceicyclus TaxID=977794 RepID=UPI0028AB3867|nr:IclR family transcriptional regulator C-terminal domain-containing protein [Actinocrinis puniceicyclus]
MAEGPHERVAPLERGLAVLRAVCASPRDTVRPGDLVRETGLARSTVDRVLSTLTCLDYLRADGREVVLAPRAMRFGDAYLAASGVTQALEPLAVRLADELDESVSVAVPDRGGVRFVVQVPRRRTMVPTFRVGDVLAASRCAPGALFAEPGPDESGFDQRIAAAARDGWALDDQLLEPGLVAVAVPIGDRAGGVARAAVSVVSHTSRHSAHSLRDFALGRLRSTAASMQVALLAANLPQPAERRADRPPAGAAPVDGPKHDLGAQYLRSLARGLEVLVRLGDHRGGMTLSAVAQATGLPRATVRRALITLSAQGYAGCPDEQGRLFEPLPAVLELGYARLCGRGAEEVVHPHLLRLSRRVRESASVAVLRGPQIAYVARVATSRIMQVAITVGTRFPAYATSMGRVLLAGLPEPARSALIAELDLRPLTRFTVTDPRELTAILAAAAADGYALVDQELEEGLRSVAAPIKDRRGRVVAAVNVSMHAGRIDAETARATVLPELVETAARISEDVAAMGDRLDFGVA